LEENQITDIEHGGTIIRRNEFLKEASEIVEDMKNGNYVTLDELKRNKEAWFKSLA